MTPNIIEGTICMRYIGYEYSNRILRISDFLLKNLLKNPIKKTIHIRVDVVLNILTEKPLSDISKTIANSEKCVIVPKAKKRKR